MAFPSWVRALRGSHLAVPSLLEHSMSFEHWQRQMAPDEPAIMFGVVARDHYVLGRVALVSGAPYSAHLLIEQAVELALKSVIKVHEPAAVFGGKDGHDLGALLARAETHVPDLKLLRQDAAAVALIETLRSGYNPVRYGERSLTIGYPEVLHTVDRLLGRLLAQVRKATRLLELTLSMHPRVVPLFLWEMKLPILRQSPKESVDGNELDSYCEVVLDHETILRT
jgi:HEPN domain-containing protein